MYTQNGSAAREAPAASGRHAPRRTYLDVLRGIAVLVMIEAHVIDSWTRAADRARDAFGYSLILGGFGAPLFLFLAGVAIPLSAGSKARRLGDERAAARAVERRGLEIFLLAFLFRVQAFVLGWGAPSTLLRVDILNIMGPSIIATAWLWGSVRTRHARIAAFALATAAIAFATPGVREAGFLSRLPDVVEAYLRPTAGLSNFVAFPWAAFVPAGAVLGVLIDGARAAETELRLNLRLLGGGLLLAGAAFALSFLPPVAGPSYFWTSSRAFFFLRAGIMCAAVGVIYLWERRPWRASGWSPLQSLGRHSLFIYWIHVEMVYGLISNPLHQSLSLRGAWLALVLFAAFMVGVAALKDWTPKNVRRQGRRRPVTLGMSSNFS
ncbi:MAG TPA: heparan-alpha-glucosaminide N-acetyltransferase domain-containing protein [Vicinamibacterales bacterium]|nr:heparan-alpha-glucosaminide N-acetyltransferase domain-containing protein [Vicinamibacterales bacterium]